MPKKSCRRQHTTKDEEDANGAAHKDWHAEAEDCNPGQVLPEQLSKRHMKRLGGARWEAGAVQSDCVWRGWGDVEEGWCIIRGRRYNNGMGW